jgi:uncharacterized protein Veg
MLSKKEKYSFHFIINLNIIFGDSANSAKTNPYAYQAIFTSKKKKKKHDNLIDWPF